MQPSDTPALLALLGRHRVDFIVVGVTAGVLQGAPVVTFDLDVVYQRSPENIGRLLEALDEIEACFRNTLQTKLGPFDVLGSLDEATGYEQLLPHTVVLRVGDYDVRLLGLERLIEEKERAGRPKDLAALPVLRATLARVRRK